MTKAEEISHVSDMIRRAVDNLSGTLKGFPGYLDRLQILADRGAYITPDTTEAIRLEADALILRQIADEMMQRRADLLANEPQYHIAAE